MMCSNLSFNFIDKECVFTFFDWLTELPYL